jgi:hypothetical protein
VATQSATAKCPPRFESSARLTWRSALAQLEQAAPLPYGLRQLRDDIECCLRFLDENQVSQK